MYDLLRVYAVTDAAALALVFAGIATVTDCYWRLVPNTLVLAFALVGVTFCHSSWSWFGFGLGLGLGFVGGLGPGDGKSFGLLGGLLGVSSILVIAMFAHATILVLMGCYLWRRMPYRGQWPLMPFISVAVYGTVAAGMWGA